MKRLFYFLIALIILITISLSQSVTAKAQETVEVAAAAICRDVVDREPVGVGDAFEALAGKLWCFTKIVGAQTPTVITHVWYFGDTERATVSLPVRSSIWRTYSSKIIQSHEIGDWHVDVLGPDGGLLQSLKFEITP
ncbi:MAG: DUF2914 domain-containing protein [Desulfatiglandales bacterium]